MNMTETEMLLRQIQSVWSSVEVSQLSIRIWSMTLADVPMEAAEQALALYVRGVSGDDYPPKPSKLLEIITTSLLNLPSEDDAWRMVVREVDRVGTGRSYFHDGKTYRLTPALPIPEIALAAESVGWRVLALNTEDPFVQRQFRQAYNRYVDATRKKLLSGPDVIDAFRANLAASVKDVRVGPPETLYELGAPPEYCAVVDGSGPLKAADVLPPGPDERAPAIPAAVQEERREIIEALSSAVADGMRGGGVSQRPAGVRSILELQKEREG